MRLGNELYQTMMGCGLTWFTTALGACICLIRVPQGDSQSLYRLFDCSLGFSAGVMLASGFWSLLTPALELSAHHLTKMGNFNEKLCFIVPAVGFLLGTLFLMLVDVFFPEQLSIDQIHDSRKHQEDYEFNFQQKANDDRPQERQENQQPMMSRRLMMLLLAITLHNIPEGAAVGVAFATGDAKNAWNLAIAIAVQNLPEGLAVSLPLRASGQSLGKSLWLGQLSGMVEFMAGVPACLAAGTFELLQPLLLSFAAGASVFVIINDIIPEMHSRANGKLSSFVAILGFIVMMALDVGTG